VQLGINKETGQEVAIKTIKKCKIETEADLIRIRREIQIMSSVQHPNIIHIYEGNVYDTIGCYDLDDTSIGMIYVIYKLANLSLNQFSFFISS